MPYVLRYKERNRGFASLASFDADSGRTLLAANKLLAPEASVLGLSCGPEDRTLTCGPDCGCRRLHLAAIQLPLRTGIRLRSQNSFFRCKKRLGCVCDGLLAGDTAVSSRIRGCSVPQGRRGIQMVMVRYTRGAPRIA